MNPDTRPILIGPGISFEPSTRSFTPRDQPVLDLIGPHLARAQRNVAALSRARRLSAGLELALASQCAGVMVLGANGRVESASERTA
jgi:hypothetical protein